MIYFLRKSNSITYGSNVHMAQKSPVDWDYHELMKGHDVMITAPKELVQLLNSIGL
ncbi:MAG: hypothetical protein WCC17_22595 [Candidatus Nitrosopolaris sp.]